MLPVNDFGGKWPPWEGGEGGSWMEVCMWDILDLLNDCFFVVFLRFWLECPEFKRFVYSLLTWKSFRWL